MPALYCSWVLRLTVEVDLHNFVFLFFGQGQHRVPPLCPIECGSARPGDYLRRAVCAFFCRALARVHSLALSRLTVVAEGEGNENWLYRKSQARNTSVAARCSPTGIRTRNRAGRNRNLRVAFCQLTAAPPLSAGDEFAVQHVHSTGELVFTGCFGSNHERDCLVFR